MPSCPSVSVLMPCLNPGPYLDEAIASCLEQPELLQLLVADGGSEAATLESLRGWAKRDPRVIWWSEADQGPADALNHALRRAEAELIGWLNADDRYEPGCLQRAVQALEQQPNWQMVYGHGQHIDEAGGFLELYPSRDPGVGIEAFQNGCFICQPTVLIRRRFLDHLGGFDAHWRVCFDLDLWLRAFSAAPEAIGFVPALQASTRLHPHTITASQQWRVHLESAALLQRSCGSVQDRWLELAAQEFTSKPESEQTAGLLTEAALTLGNSELAERLKAAIERLQAGGSSFPETSELPEDLRLLLHSRPDLIAIGFHQPTQQRAFAQWLLLHGLREYSLVAGDAQTNPVIAWLAQPDPSTGLPRLLQAIWDSTARHRRRWPLPRRGVNYQRWLRHHWNGLPQQPLPTYQALFGPGGRERLLRWLRGHRDGSIPHAAGWYLPGVNVIGHASHALGVGEDLRTTVLALRQVDVAQAEIDFPPRSFAGRELSSLGRDSAQAAPYRVTLLCLTAEETIRYVLSQGRTFLEDRYVIGYWPWELPHWPLSWQPAFDLVDEIWVSTHHIQNAVQQATGKPVVLMPLCVDAEELHLFPRSENFREQLRHSYGLPEQGVLVLCSFDLKSSIHRKNPWGAILAFQRAFPLESPALDRDNVALIVKSFPPDQPDQHWDHLKQLVARDPRIHIVEANLSRSELSDLYGSCDVLLSLHRAEGFGRVLAEALQLGLDVVATDWSGNTDFCTGPLAHPVPCALAPVRAGAYPHWRGQEWAQPDVSVAAKLLRGVVRRREEYGLPDQEVSAPYREQFSAVSCGLRYRQRLEQLGLLSGPGAHPAGSPGSSPLPPG